MSDNFRNHNTSKFLDIAQELKVQYILALEPINGYCSYMTLEPEVFEFVKGTPNTCLFEIK